MFSGSSVSLAAPPKGPRVVGILVIGKSLTSNSLRSYLFPIASHQGGAYHDASITSVDPGEVARLRSRSVLNQVKTFAIHDGGSSRGSYAVTKIVKTQFACTEVIVGTGTVRWERPPDFSSGEVGFVLDNTKVRMREFVAVGGGSAREFPMQERYAPTEQEQALLSRRAEDQLRKFISGKAIIVKPMRFRRAIRVDLDGDRQHEILAEFAAPVTKPESAVSGQPGQIRVTVVARVRPSAQELLALVAMEMPGSEVSEAYDFVAAVDADGDRKAELLFVYAIGEVSGYRLFTLRNRYIKVFDGAQTGC